MDDISFAMVSGNTGESCVNHILIQSGLKFYHNLYFEDNNGNIAQVDFLVVTDRCLICIEVKTYNRCIIRGSEFDKRWYVNYLSKSKNVYNPILQNSIHIRTILDCLKYKELPILNYVVFTNSCSLGITKPVTVGVKVMSMSELWYEILTDMNKGRKLKRCILDEIIDIIDSYDVRVDELSEKHCRKYFSGGV